MGPQTYKYAKCVCVETVDAINRQHNDGTALKPRGCLTVESVWDEK